MEKDLFMMNNFNMYNIMPDTYSHVPSFIVCLLKKNTNYLI